MYIYIESKYPRQGAPICHIGSCRCNVTAVRRAVSLVTNSAVPCVSPKTYRSEHMSAEECKSPGIDALYGSLLCIHSISRPTNTAHLSYTAAQHSQLSGPHGAIGGRSCPNHSSHSASGQIESMASHERARLPIVVISASRRPGQEEHWLLRSYLANPTAHHGHAETLESLRTPPKDE